MAVARRARWAARLVRHRWKLIDGSVLGLAVLLAAFYAFEVDLFEAVPGSPVHQRIELDEAMAIAAVFCGGLVIFAYRRLREARRETARRVEAERQARTLAFHDALTGLPNRRQFEEALRAAAAQPPRANAAHVFMLLDLNGFKRVNDVYGHQAGDDVLVQVAGRLSRVMREGDLVARLGGDEFAVLATHAAGGEAATGLAARIIEALRAPIAAGGAEHEIGTGIGVAMTPQDGTDSAELLRKADIALYRAKAERGAARSAMRFFEEAMDARVRERDVLEHELRQAIADRTVRPFYQPLVTLDGLGIAGFEALARWTSPTLGEVEPERFIAVAEDTGLIGALSVQLLEQACTDAVTWPRAVTLSFNISGALLQDPLFGLKVVQILSRTGMRPTQLELEITESALVRDLEAARTILGELRTIGVRIALDDFGTGYSSLYHLRAFKPDKIKIDRSFVSGMAQDADNMAIVQALIGLGSGLGVTITAEGVETVAQEDFLRAQGCEQGQGHLFSRAVDADAARALVGQPAHEERRRRA